jgi:hypothetical protein
MRFANLLRFLITIIGRKAMIEARFQAIHRDILVAVRLVYLQHHTISISCATLIQTFV